MNLPFECSTAMTTATDRIRHVLHFIHRHMDRPLSVEDIAAQSCWSRWQLQRVFQSELGISVGQYVRELKLSAAAEQLLDSKQRSIDIAFELGFGSEIAFSRAFRQMFGVSPRAYRQAGQRTGLRKPMIVVESSPSCGLNTPFVEVRVESREQGDFYGVSTPICGLFSDKPNFSHRVPKLWQQILAQFDLSETEKFGVIDVTTDPDKSGRLTYWASIRPNALPATAHKTFQLVTVPAQTYAVIKHRGKISALPETLLWFMLHWLPNSEFRGIDGFEIEQYPPDYDGEQPMAIMEYWLPIKKVGS